MENCTVWERKLLVDLLILGEDKTRQLEAHLNEHSQAEPYKTFAQEIQSIFRKAISMANLADPENGQQPACPTGAGDSPRSVSDSLLTESSERPERMEMCKKRKTLPTRQMRVGSGPGAQPPVEDGFSWRKYGQKDILGTKYPRGYYRCTHRNTQGCLAMKQLQRSDENPAFFDVTYRGEHTCCQKAKMGAASVPKEPKIRQKQIHPPDQSQQQQYAQDQSLLQNFRANLKVKTEGLDSEDQGLNPSPFSFPSTPVSCLTPENIFFSSSPTLDNHFMANASPAFLSATTSKPNYFSVCPCPMGDYAGGPSINASESYVTEIMSAMTSGTNSPVVDMNFLDFDSTFQLDTSDFY